MSFKSTLQKYDIGIYCMLLSTPLNLMWLHGAKIPYVLHVINGLVFVVGIAYLLTSDDGTRAFNQSMDKSGGF